MAVDWQMVRLDRRTVARLRELLAQLADVAGAANVQLPEQRSDNGSIDYAVRTLLDRNDRHKQRGRNRPSKTAAPTSAEVERSDGRLE